MNAIFALLFAVAAATHAAPRTSLDYTMVAETTDSGGRRATSADYTNDGSVCAVAGISTVAAPAGIAKQGYIAQLVEVIGVVVNAAAPSVNETATFQLSAQQLLDDATFLAVPTTTVNWGVVSGPITGISLAGLATAGIVSQNTPATVQGNLEGFTGSLNLTVLDSIPDNFGAYAGDSLGDDWQVQYFGQPPNANAGPLLDPDSDGQTNFFEFTAGLVPTDPASRLTLTIAPVPDPGNPGQFLAGQKKLIFNPLVLTAGRTYTVKVRPDLATGTWTTLTGTTQSDLGSQRTVIDLSATGAAKFYQVEITKP